MWNPLSWVMEAAALVAILLSNGPEPWLCATPGASTCYSENAAPDWPDFIGIICLLLINSSIGYYEEEQAGAAVDALMDQLLREYKVLRNGEWTTCPSRELVPGDIIIIKLGDIIPADCKLLHGEPMKIDQAALTGESLPVTRHPGQDVFSGSTVKQGEIEAIIHSTGVNTFFGKAANLVATTEGHGHLQQILTLIGLFCMSYIGIWIIILCSVQYGLYHWDYRRGIDMVLVVLIGGIPIAMPTVLSVTMAIGVHELAQEQAVVTRITAVEELAGMDILCSDKTGTLTLNQLTVKEPTTVEPYKPSDALLAAALAARRHGDPDAIDRCIMESMTEEQRKEMNDRYEVTKFVPFDPSSKRTEAHITDRTTGAKFLCSKGAPQIIIGLAHNADEIRDPQNLVIADYASRGLRAIGVARSDDEGKTWNYIGLLSLSDPPRPDTKATIQAAVALGIRIIMITGDQIAIGRETARELGMGLNFHAAHVLKQQFIDGVPISQVIEESQGWGEVMPEDKYKVVQALRENGHLVGMTGDGVNDAPALKAADVGIAVAGATDAARGAADMVLLSEGLSVIIKAILGSRCIFQRMRNYATYACATTIRIVTTFGILATVWEFSYPPFLVLIIAILNDGTIMTVSTDRVQPSPRPDSWRLRTIFITAFVLGYYLAVSSIVYFYLIVHTTWFQDTFGVEGLHYNTSYPGNYANAKPTQSTMIVGIIYLQVSITGQMVIFNTRTRSWFWTTRPSYFLMGAFVIAQIVATIIAVYAYWPFTQLSPIGWGWAAVTWVWSLVWWFPLDIPKIILRKTLEGEWAFMQWPSSFEGTFGNAMGKRGWGGHKPRTGSQGRERRGSMGSSQRPGGSGRPMGSRRKN